MNSDNTEEKQDKRKTLPQLFKPGESGNPNGRPKGVKNMSTLLWEALQKKARREDGTESDKIMAELVVDRLIKDNIKLGKNTDLIFDRIDGKAVQPLDITSNGETVTQASDDILKMAAEISAQLKKKKT